MREIVNGNLEICVECREITRLFIVVWGEWHMRGEGAFALGGLWVVKGKFGNQIIL